MSRWLRTTGMVVAFGLVAWGAMASSTAWGQTRERDVTVTGPRGNTISRQLKSTVTPGGLDRQTTITRPGGTFTRDVHISRPVPAVVPPAPRPWIGGGRPPMVLERNVFVGPRFGGGVSGGEAFGLGVLGAAVGTGAGLLMGRAMAPPPAPVMVAPAPVLVAPGPVVAGPPAVVTTSPGVVVGQPAVVQNVPPPPPNPEVNQAIGKLASWHENTRKESCYILGRLGDPRAVPALVDTLKTDHSTNVRIAAAMAIGQIGDPSSAIFLQRSATYDKKQEVRDAARVALSRMPQPQPASVMSAQPPTATASARPSSGVTRSYPAPTPPPSDLRPIESGSSDVPPPPPTPVLPSSESTRR